MSLKVSPNVFLNNLNEMFKYTLKLLIDRFPPKALNLLRGTST